MAPRSSDSTTRTASPCPARTASAAGACRSLVSHSSAPPGASQPGASAATRPSRPSPSGPPSRVTRGSCSLGLGGQQRDLVGRHVGHVRHQHVHLAAQGRWQRRVEVALQDAAQVPDVATRARHRGRLDVGGVQLDPRDGPRHHHPEAARTAAQVDHDRRTTGRDRPRQGDRLARQQLGAPPGHEHAGVQGDPQPAELRPADHLLQRVTRAACRDHPGELVGTVGRADQQVGLVLGEHAPGRPQPLDHRRPPVGTGSGPRVGLGAGWMRAGMRAGVRAGMRAGVRVQETPPARYPPPSRRERRFPTRRVGANAGFPTPGRRAFRAFAPTRRGLSVRSRRLGDRKLHGIAVTGPCLDT